MYTKTKKTEDSLTDEYAQSSLLVALLEYNVLAQVWQLFATSPIQNFTIVRKSLAPLPAWVELATPVNRSKRTYIGQRPPLKILNAKNGRKRKGNGSKPHG